MKGDGKKLPSLIAGVTLNITLKRLVLSDERVIGADKTSPKFN